MSASTAAFDPGAGQRPRQTLASRVYCDPELFAREQERIFARTWQFVCHVEKLRKPGDFVVCDVAGESLIVIRAEDGNIKAFFNVCLHRASRLLSGEGCKKRITCPYHAWTYDTAGKLIAAPNAKKVAGFAPDSHALRPCRVEELHGLVFLNLDEAAAPLRDLAVGLETELQDYAPRLPELTFVHRTEAHLKANWKVAVENYSECYHCSLVHPTFVSGVVDPQSYRVRVHGLWQKHLSKSRTGTAKAYDYDEGATAHAQEFGASWLWPNFAFQSYPGGSVHVWKWTPLAVDHTHVTVDWHFPSRDLKDWERDVIEHHAATTFAEDVPIVESVQQGLASRTYDRGPLMIDEERSNMSEHAVAAIQELWREAMRGQDA